MSNRTILLVEDSVDEELLTIRALKKSIHVLDEVVVARDGVEALDYLSATGSGDGRQGQDPGMLPHLILLDLKLPKMDGLEVLRRLRAADRTQRLPVVILTSSKEQQDLLQCYRLGANSYIHKPVNFQQFTDMMRQLCMYWLVLNQAPL